MTSKIQLSGSARFHPQTGMLLSEPSLEMEHLRNDFPFLSLSESLRKRLAFRSTVKVRRVELFHKRTRPLQTSTGRPFIRPQPTVFIDKHLMNATHRSSKDTSCDAPCMISQALAGVGQFCQASLVLVDSLDLASKEAGEEITFPGRR